MKIFLDDKRMPTFIYPDTKDEEWAIIRTFDDFVGLINTIDISKITYISFDHDLGDFKDGEERHGATCAKFICQYAIDNNKELNFDYKVHSSNPGGSLNVESYIETYKKIRGIK